MRSTPVFLLGESHGQRSLVGYSPRGHKESDMTERLHLHLHIHYMVWDAPFNLPYQVIFSTSSLPYFMSHTEQKLTFNLNAIKPTNQSKELGGTYSSLRDILQRNTFVLDTCCSDPPIILSSFLLAEYQFPPRLPLAPHSQCISEVGYGLSQ